MLIGSGAPIRGDLCAYSPRRGVAWHGLVMAGPPGWTRDGGSCRQFGCQYIDGFDVGRGGEELVGALDEGGGDGAVQVRLAAGGGGEEVGDGAWRGVDFDREP